MCALGKSHQDHRGASNDEIEVENNSPWKDHIDHHQDEKNERQRERDREEQQEEEEI